MAALPAQVPQLLSRMLPLLPWPRLGPAVGDSAGGNLVLAMTAAIRDRGAIAAARLPGCGSGGAAGGGAATGAAAPPADGGHGASGSDTRRAGASGSSPTKCMVSVSEVEVMASASEAEAELADSWLGELAQLGPLDAPMAAAAVARLPLAVVLVSPAVDISLAAAFHNEAWLAEHAREHDYLCAKLLSRSLSAYVGPGRPHDALAHPLLSPVYLRSLRGLSQVSPAPRTTCGCAARAAAAVYCCHCSCMPRML